MAVLQQEPNWDLVTDAYTEPRTFADLLALLIPKAPSRDGASRALLAWKEREFYKTENIRCFIQYGMKKISELPTFHKDEIPAILRIVRLCQEIGWYEAAYALMENQNLIQFVHTASSQESWDALTKTVAWNYLIVKQKAFQLEEEDSLIWERIKFDEEWTKQYKELVSHKEILELTFIYLCRQAKRMDTAQLDENIMQLGIYCNTLLYEMYTYNLIRKYEKCVDFLEQYYQPDPAVIACQRAVIALVIDMFHLSERMSDDDFLVAMTELMSVITPNFTCKYEAFIGQLLSYIPFFEMIRVPKQVDCIEKLLYKCKEVEYREQLLRKYVFSQMLSQFASFVKPMLANKRYAIIHEILFYWCTAEERAELEGKYNLNKIYQLYACG